MEPTSPGAEDAVRFRERGLRSTAPRRATLRLLRQGGHYTAAETFARVRTELPGTSQQAIYNVLAALTEVGLARKIELQGNTALYESHLGDNHHHVVCERCGRFEDVPCTVGAAPCLTPSESHGFDISSADVTYRGLCPDCAE